MGDGLKSLAESLARGDEDIGTEATAAWFRLGEALNLISASLRKK